MTIPSLARGIVVLLRSLLFCIGFLLILLTGTGCKNIQASLNFHSYVAVKIPGDESQIPPDVVSTNGWKFIHLAACAYETRTEQGEIVPDAPAQWYLSVRTKKNGKPEHVPWFLARRGYAKARKWLPDIADASKAQFGIYPITLEVVNVLDPLKDSIHNKPDLKVTRTQANNAGPASLALGAQSNPSWPAGTNLMWHLGPGYSQLAAARDKVNARQGNGPWKVKVGILDTGFSGTHAAMPQFLDESVPTNNSAPCKADAWNLIACAFWPEGIPCRSTLPSRANGDHGTGTIGILAGRNVSITNASGESLYEGPLGGIPEATIVPVRVAPWVFSINTANFAYAIDYASRVKGCDVVSMSHGGAPSLLWYDTINSAYWRGTALIAATGDFFSIGTYKRAATLIPPSWTVYPAAARRVLGVTGATAAFTSYAAPTWKGYLNSWAHLQPLASLERGSYGADGSWRNSLDSDERGDVIAAERQGPLRIHPIAGYSPNIPWPVSAPKPHSKTNIIRLDGGGTSAATPQVAAAAAIWLEYNKSDWTNLPPESKWMKPEGVYQALLRSADRSRGDCWPNTYLGAGLLKADDALNRSFRDLIHADSEYKINRFQRSPRDFFDGSKSLRHTLDRIGGRTGAERDLTQKFFNEFEKPPTPATSREDALFICFYNTSLVQAWHHGKTPQSNDREKMKETAKERAARASKLTGFPR
jgi:hypothetical protein